MRQLQKLLSALSARHRSEKARNYVASFGMKDMVTLGNLKGASGEVFGDFTDDSARARAAQRDPNKDDMVVKAITNAGIPRGAGACCLNFDPLDAFKGREVNDGRFEPAVRVNDFRRLTAVIDSMKDMQILFLDARLPAHVFWIEVLKIDNVLWFRLHSHWGPRTLWEDYIKHGKYGKYRKYLLHWEGFVADMESLSPPIPKNFGYDLGLIEKYEKAESEAERKLIYPAEKYRAGKDELSARLRYLEKVDEIFFAPNKQNTLQSIYRTDVNERNYDATNMFIGALSIKSWKAYQHPMASG